MTVLLYTRRKGWPLESVTVELSHERVPAGGPQEKTGASELVHVYVLVRGQFTQEQVERIRAIAGQCPVHRTLTRAPRIIQELDVVA